MKSLKKYLFYLAGALICAAAISLFIDPNDLAPGGFTGLSILLNRVLPLQTGTLLLLLNIPVLIVGYVRFGSKFLISTLYVVSLMSLFTNLLSRREPFVTDPLLGGIFGGAMLGAGMGIILKTGATTGGTDIIIRFLRIRFPYITTGTFMLLLDIVIFLFAWFVFRQNAIILYSILSVGATTIVVDLVLYGRDGAKMIYIVSDKSQLLGRRLMEELQAGVTFLNGRGAYRNKDTEMILCVIRNPLVVRLEEIVKTEDPEAFMIVSSASEIFGKGYKSYFQEKI